MRRVAASAGSMAGLTQVALSRSVSRATASRLRLKASQRASSTRPSAAPGFGQPHVGIVFAQLQPVFGAAGEHAIGLGDAARDEVIDQHAEVGLVPPRTPGILALHLQAGVDARQQPLCRRLFVAGGAVDLAGEKQAADRLGFERGFQVARIVVIVFDGVAGTQDVRVFQPGNRAHDGELHVERQRSRNAVGIDLVGGQAFGFEKDLVAVLVGKARDLVLDRRAIARPHPVDHAGIQGRTIEAAANDLVRFGRGVGYPARALLGMQSPHRP